MPACCTCCSRPAHHLRLPNHDCGELHHSIANLHLIRLTIFSRPIHPPSNFRRLVSRSLDKLPIFLSGPHRFSSHIDHSFALRHLFSVNRRDHPQKASEHDTTG